MHCIRSQTSGLRTGVGAGGGRIFKKTMRISKFFSEGPETGKKTQTLRERGSAN